MNKTLIVIIILVAILGIYSWSSYNGLVAMRESTTALWQQVEVQYQRRFDLIPNLVESTKSILVQEQTVFSDIADARSRYAGAQTVNDKVGAATQVESALGRLLVVMENYPVLRSSETVRDLMTQLEGAENRISVERSRFNDGVRVYNTMIKKFPKNFFASAFGFDAFDYFESQEGTENVPKVELI